MLSLSFKSKLAFPFVVTSSGIKHILSKNTFLILSSTTVSVSVLFSFIEVSLLSPFAEMSNLSIIDDIPFELDTPRSDCIDFVDGCKSFGVILLELEFELLGVISNPLSKSSSKLFPLLILFIAI